MLGCFTAACPIPSQTALLTAQSTLLVHSLLVVQFDTLGAAPISPAVLAGVQEAPGSWLATAASRAQLPEMWRQVQALAKSLGSRQVPWPAGLPLWRGILAAAAALAALALDR